MHFLYLLKNKNYIHYKTNIIYLLVLEKNNLTCNRFLKLIYIIKNFPIAKKSFYLNKLNCKVEDFHKYSGVVHSSLRTC